MLFLAVADALTCTSCSQLNNDQKTARVQAEERWSNVRAKLKLQIASESFDRGETGDAQKQLAEALALDPTVPAAYVLQTRILLERGEMAAARDALNTAIGRGADSAETDYLTGVIAQRYGRFEDALLAYRQAAQRDPRNAHYVAAVAETLVALDSPAEALALIESRWTDFEHNATLRAIAGQIHMLMGRYEQAADIYRDAVRISPDDRTLQCQFGLALSLSDKHAEAVSVLEPLIQNDKDTPGYLLVALGRAYIGQGRLEEAKSTLRRAARVSPDNPPAWTWLARAALLGGDLVTAREAAARAAELAKAAPEPFILLGYVCLRQGHAAAAVRALETALQKQPDDSLSLYLLAQARRTLRPEGPTFSLPGMTRERSEPASSMGDAKQATGVPGANHRPLAGTVASEVNSP